MSQSAPRQSKPRRALGGLLLTLSLTVFILPLPSSVQAKEGGTYYTPEKVEAIRNNVQRYDWAKKQRDKAVKKADYYLRRLGGLEGLWNLVTSQSVPRADIVNAKKGSPVSGKKIFEGRGFNPWEADPEHPWKVIDPESGKMFPSNDFEAYYKSGLNEHHKFDPDLADKSLLVNELYPDKGKNKWVDDGHGWIDDEGNRYAFVADYNKIEVWKHGVYDALPAFRKAYLYSGNVKYARAGLVLLDRVADVYPEMDLSAYPWSYDNIFSHGGKGTGKVFGCIHAAAPAERMCKDYDAFYPEADDPELISFLSEKAKKYDLNDKSSAGAIRENIEENIIKQMLPAVKKSRINGNFGHEQSVLAISAVVADDPGGYTKRALDFMFQAGGNKKVPAEGQNKPTWRVTGGDIVPHLVNIIDRNGQNDEASPNYNTIPLRALGEIADTLADYDGYQGFDFVDSVKFKAMHSGRVPLLMIGKYFPHIGDAAATAEPGMPTDMTQCMLRAFRLWGDEIFAVATYIANGQTTEGLHGPITSEDPGRLARQIQRIVDKRGTRIKSSNQAGYGLSGLRDGQGDNRRAAWMWYGITKGSHPHQDALNLGYFGFGLDLLPDLGYPTRTGKWPKRHNWTAATVSHNTVTVDGEQQVRQIVGKPHHFEGGRDVVQLTDVAVPAAYPNLDLYRRVTGLIRVDDQNSYMVDFFRIRGGKDHVFSFHSAEGEVQTENLSLSPQDGGTYAGPDIPLPGHGKNTPYNKKGGWPNEGFNYLHDVSRDKNPAKHLAVDWRIKDTYGVVGDKGQMTDTHLRFTGLGNYDEAALAQGNPPLRGDNPKSLNYLLLRRQGKDLNSTFTSVIEPYRHQRQIKSIEALPVDGPEDAMARAVKVTLQDGRTDYIASALDGQAQYSIQGAPLAFSGQFAFLRLNAQGQPIRARLVDGRFLVYRPSQGQDRYLVKTDQGRFNGRVVSFKKGLNFENQMTVQLDGASPEDVKGRWIFVKTDGQREGKTNGAYKILDAKSKDGNLTLNLGEITLVREMKNPDDLEAGFVYNIKRGAPCTVPLSAAWQKSQ